MDYTPTDTRTTLKAYTLKDYCDTHKDILIYLNGKFYVVESLLENTDKVIIVGGVEL